MVQRGDRHRPRRPTDYHGLNDGPLVTQSSAIRRYFEGAIFADLAGPAGAMFCPPFSANAYMTDDDEGDDRRALERAEALNRLSPRHAELLFGHERNPEPIDDDETRAARVAGVSVTSAGIGHFLEWLRYEVRAMLEVHHRQLAAVAAALRATHVLTGPHVLAAMSGTRCVCHGTW